jgi:uncharacterized protein YjbJ (UPF0337 family)
MDKENIKGAAQKAKGQVEEVAGKILGDKELELKGRADQVRGAVREAVGTTKDAIKEAVEEVKKI